MTKLTKKEFITNFLDNGKVVVKTDHGLIVLYENYTLSLYSNYIKEGDYYEDCVTHAGAYIDFCPTTLQYNLITPHGSKLDISFLHKDKRKFSEVST